MKYDYIKNLKELIAIESVADLSGENPKYPYGKAVNNALLYVLNLCRELGFRTKNCDNKTAWAEIGGGKPLVGILVHLDTVPLGENWTKKQGQIHNGKLYGRGAIDDKGPVIACIYAMKHLLDEGGFHGRVRLILGQTEETGNWQDIEYYKEHEELPDLGFTPDADFPAIYAEKGISTLVLRCKEDSGCLLSLYGGTASNVVPSHCKVSLNTAFCKDNSVDIPRQISTEGKSAHAANPEAGINAISLLMEKLYRLKLHLPFVDFYHKYIGMTCHGERFDLDVQNDDISGKFSFNPGIITYEKNCITMTADMRYPVTGSFEKLLKRLAVCAEPYGISIETKMHMKPVYFDRNSPLICKLLTAYQDETDDTSAPLAIGGGTYARAMENIAAYGALMPGRPLTEHQADEYIELEDLEQAIRIYEKALKGLLDQSI